MDSLPLNIHHTPHQNLPLLHFSPVKNEHPPPFFQDNKSRLPCHQKCRWSGKFLFSVVSHNQSENTTRQWENSSASLIHLNPRHYYANEPNSAHLILTEVCCWSECLIALHGHIFTWKMQINFAAVIIHTDSGAKALFFSFCWDNYLMTEYSCMSTTSSWFMWKLCHQK